MKFARLAAAAIGLTVAFSVTACGSTEKAGESGGDTGSAEARWSA